MSELSFVCRGKLDTVSFSLSLDAVHLVFLCDLLSIE